jgi:hypothetical protein
MVLKEATMNCKQKWFKVVLLGLAGSERNAFGARKLYSFSTREEAGECAESLRKAGWDTGEFAVDE